MTMRVTMLQTRMGESGSLLVAGSTYTVSRALGALLVQNRFATDLDSALSPPSLEPVRFNETVDSTWIRVPSIFRLRIAGTGTLQMDSKDSLGNITLAAFPLTSYTNETDKIEFPYAGDAAVLIRLTLTGTLTCEVI